MCHCGSLRITCHVFPGVCAYVWHAKCHLPPALMSEGWCTCQEGLQYFLCIVFVYMFKRYQRIHFGVVHNCQPSNEFTKHTFLRPFHLKSAQINVFQIENLPWNDKNKNRFKCWKLYGINAFFHWHVFP